jgi:hypothetical protein
VKNPNMFLVGSVVLILLAVALVAILDRTSPTGNSADVRARATTKQALTLLATVATVDEAKGTIQVDNMQFADNSRAGTAQNLGSWVVTAPAGFNFASVSTGVQVAIGVDPQTFQISKHALTALSLAPAK